MRNYGVDLERERREQDGTEWNFGALSKPCLYSVDILKREQYLPDGEIQFLGGTDKQDCVTRAYLNDLATKFTAADQTGKMSPENRAWGRAVGYANEQGRWDFSDAYIGILSGTTRSGNSLKAPAHAIHTHGLIPKSKLPQLKSWDAHYDPKRITPELKALGAEFLRRFVINYEQVYIDDLTKLLLTDMAVIAVEAWPEPINGE